MGLADIIRDVHGPAALRPAIDQFLRKEEANKDPRDDGWHPSQFCGMCARAAVLHKLVGDEESSEPIEPRLRRIFDVGHALHDWYQNNYLANMGILWGKWQCEICEKVRWGFLPASDGCSYSKDDRHLWEYKEVPVFGRMDDCEKPLVGHSDGIIRLRNAWYVLEMKTINDRGFSVLKEAKPGHVLQAQIYGEMIRQGRIPDCDIEIPKPSKLLLLYINKNRSEEKEFVVDMDHDVGIRELSRPREHEMAFQNRVLPDRRPECVNLLKPPAKNCSMCSHCFGTLGWDDLEAIGRTA